MTEDWRNDTLDGMVRELHTRTRSSVAERLLSIGLSVSLIPGQPFPDSLPLPRRILDVLGMRELLDFLCLMEVAGTARMLPDEWPLEVHKRVSRLCASELVKNASETQQLPLVYKLRDRLASLGESSSDNEVPAALFQWFLDLTIPFRRDRSVQSFMRRACRGDIAYSAADRKGLRRFIWYISELDQLLEQTRKKYPAFSAAVWHSHGDWAAHRKQIQASVTGSLEHYAINDQIISSAIRSVLGSRPSLGYSIDVVFEKRPLTWREAAAKAVTGPATLGVALPKLEPPRPVPSSLVALDNVGKVFYTDEVETHALSNVNLSIDKGEFIAIAGPSGSGKSTLLAILGLLDSPTTGTYWLNGKAASDLALSERARLRNLEIGFVFQSFNLIGDLTVFQNVELPLVYRGLDQQERRRRVSECLEMVGMAHRARHLPSQLSGGQQQRVAVARAVVGQPSIVLADEPTGNLDSKNGEMIMDLLRELNRQGSTMCLVTHDPRYAQYASRSINLFDGRVVDVIGDYAPSGSSAY
jgi:putative ABC transport system ATP-binding protein